MGYNIFEKILLKHTQRNTISTNDIVEVDVDGMMIHDFFAPFCISKFYEMGFKKVVNPDRVVMIYDHLVPTSFAEDFHHHHTAEIWAWF